jgi:Toprim-like
MINLRTIAHALGGEVSGHQVLAPGPGHSAQDRSLSIQFNGHDDFVVHSFADDDPLACKDYVRGKLGLPDWKPGNGHDPVIASYIYKDAGGNPYLRVNRTAGKNFWQQRWDGAEWRNGAPVGPKIPYRLPELIAADPATPVYVVEGEKDADSLANLGLMATTASGGSKNIWAPEFNRHFAGRNIRILPDNDEPGGQYARRIADTLHSIAGSVRIVDLPGGWKDVSEWLEQGNTVETLEFLAEDAAPWGKSSEAPEDPTAAFTFIGDAPAARPCAVGVPGSLCFREKALSEVKES